MCQKSNTITKYSRDKFVPRTITLCKDFLLLASCHKKINVCKIPELLPRGFVWFYFKGCCFYVKTTKVLFAACFGLVTTGVKNLQTTNIYLSFLANFPAGSGKMTDGRDTGRSGLASSLPREFQAVGGLSEGLQRKPWEISILFGLPQVTRSQWSLRSCIQS